MAWRTTRTRRKILISTQVPISYRGRCIFSQRLGRFSGVELGSFSEQYLQRDTVSDSRVRFSRMGGPRAAYGDESRSLRLPREDALPTAGGLYSGPSAATRSWGGVAVARAVSGPGVTVLFYLVVT